MLETIKNTLSGKNELDNKGNDYNQPRNQNSGLKFIGGLSIAFVAIVIGLSSIKFVPVNHVGVKFNRVSGEIFEEPIPSGMKFKTPFVEQITSVSTELRSADIDDINVTTKDGLGAMIDVELQYFIKPEHAVDTFKQFRSVHEDDWIRTFVYQRIQRGVQESASKYTASELNGEKRGKFQTDVDQTIEQALESNHLGLQSASVDDIYLDESIRQTIAEKVKMQQEVETAEQKRQKQKVENQARIEKEETDAKTKEIQSKAEADANKRLSESITDELIRYRETEARFEHGWYKYNGTEPVVVEKE